MTKEITIWGDAWFLTANVRCIFEQVKVAPKVTCLCGILGSQDLPLPLKKKKGPLWLLCGE